MIGWRDQVLLEFPNDGPLLCIARDMYGLLADAQIETALAGNGYRMVAYDDPIRFRYGYERAREACESAKAWRLILRSVVEGERLPFDLIRAGRAVDLRLERFFPGLDPTVLAVLDHRSLDPLYRACRRERPSGLCESASWDFVLQHLLGVKLQAVRGSVELLRLLLVCHEPENSAPRPLRNYLLRRLRERPQFREWPLETILFDADLFHSFVRERYTAHMRRGREATGLDRLVREGARPALLRFPSPVHLPFGHPRIRPLIRRLLGRGVLNGP